MKPVVLDADFSVFVDNLLAEWKAPGGTGVAFVRLDESNNWDVETKGFGNATQSGIEKLTVDSQFSIASNSKIFTVILVGIALEEKKSQYPAGWKTKVRTILPEWGTLHTRLEAPLNRNPEYVSDLEVTAREATLEDLISHRTGWSGHDGFYSMSMTLSTLLGSYLPNLRRSASFRETFQYNNIMYMVLSFLPSIILNTTDNFPMLMERYVFHPLGLESATYDYAKAKNETLADGFTRQVQIPRPDGDTSIPKDVWKKLTEGNVKVWPYWDEAQKKDGIVNAGPGGIIMSVKDSALWLQVLLLEGKNPRTGEQVIPKTVIQKVLTGLTVASPKSRYPEQSPVIYGGGQGMGSYRGHAYAEHGGGTLGFVSRIIHFPNDGFGIAVLINNDVVGQYMLDTIKWRIVDKVLDLETIDWNTRVKEGLYQAVSARPPRKTRAEEPIDPSTLASLEGEYRNPSIGTVRLCFVPTNSTSCSPLVSSLDLRLPGVFSPDQDVPTLVFKKDNIWTNYVKLTHSEGAMWEFSPWRSTEEVDRREEWWATTELGGMGKDRAFAEFAFSQKDGEPVGFGLRGIWGGDWGTKEVSGDSVVERSEMWFEKV